MGAAGPTKRGGSIADINVTPLVDVVLVLLIIFMVVGDLLAEETPESSIPTVTSVQVTSKRHKTTACTPSIDTS